MGVKQLKHLAQLTLLVMRASTIVFDSIKSWREIRDRRITERVLSYGARGTETAFALEALVTELEGGYRAQLFPTGASRNCIYYYGLRPKWWACFYLLILSMNPYVNSPCFLEPNNITYSFLKTDGSDFEQKIQENTQLIFVESPGSLLL